MPPQRDNKDQRPPSKPQQKPTVSTADVLRPTARPVPVTAGVTTVIPNYNIGQTVTGGNTVSSGWNTPIVLQLQPKPDMPIPTPAMIPLDMKRQAAYGAGYTDAATRQLYQTKMNVLPDTSNLNPNGYMGLYEGGMGSDPNGQITVWRGPGWDNMETIRHENAHSNMPVSESVAKDFLPDVQRLAASNSDTAYNALQVWESAAPMYSDPKGSQMMETYAFMAESLGDPYLRSQVPQWFLDKYYPGMYKKE